MQKKTQHRTKPAPIKYVSVPVPKRGACCELQLPNTSTKSLAVKATARGSKASYDLVGLAG